MDRPIKAADVEVTETHYMRRLPTRHGRSVATLIIPLSAAPESPR